MVEEVRAALAELGDQKYEIAGFVWQQGWNDMCTKPAIPEYAQNLVNLVKDLRKEFNVPNMPVVVGELGNGGPVTSGDMFEFRKAQEEGTKQIKNALFIKTTDFARPAELSPNTGHGHHWFGNAESYFLIGDALGEGMKRLLKRIGEIMIRTLNERNEISWHRRESRRKQPPFSRPPVRFSGRNNAKPPPRPSPKSNFLAFTALLALAVTLPLNRVWAADTAKPQKDLPLPGEVFEVDGRTAFVILPAAENLHTNRPTPWVWYAPTLPGLPEARERWMFERFLAAGIAVAGVDVGESYGNPQGRAHFTAFYQELVERRGFSRKPVPAATQPRRPDALQLGRRASGFGGRHRRHLSRCNLRSWPGLDQACGAYGLTAAQLEEQLAQHNPIDRLAPLAKAGVPIFHIHGDADDVVPLKDNSALLASRYRELGGSMRLRIPPGQGHNVWDGFFQCQELVEFVIAHASPAAESRTLGGLVPRPAHGSPPRRILGLDERQCGS